jgi:hypothetical protein
MKRLLEWPYRPIVIALVSLLVGLVYGHFAYR